LKPNLIFILKFTSL